MFSDNTRAKEYSIITCSNAFTQIQRTHRPKVSPRSKLEAGLAFSKGSFLIREWLLVEN